MDVCREGANEREPPRQQPGKQQISSTPPKGFGVAGGIAKRRRVGSLPEAGVPREQRELLMGWWLQVLFAARSSSLSRLKSGTVECQLGSSLLPVSWQALSPRSAAWWTLS